MTNQLSMPILHKYTGNRGGMHREGLEDPHIQMGACNSIEKDQPFCIHESKNKQQRMPTCCLSQMTGGTFKSPEEIKRWCFN